MPSEPSGSDRIQIGDFGYLRARNKHRLYTVVIDEFKRCGLSQADLARRLGTHRKAQQVAVQLAHHIVEIADTERRVEVVVVGDQKRVHAIDVLHQVNLEV